MNKQIEPEISGVGVKLETIPPKQNRRGSQSLYPFDKIGVGECFGVKNKKAAQLTQIIANQNRKYTVDAKDDAGNIIYTTKKIQDASGKTIEVPDTSKPKQVPVRQFYAVDVDGDLKEQIKGTDLEGSSVLVFRSI